MDWEKFWPIKKELRGIHGIHVVQGILHLIPMTRGMIHIYDSFHSTFVEVVKCLDLCKIETVSSTIESLIWMIFNSQEIQELEFLSKTRKIFQMLGKSHRKLTRSYGIIPEVSPEVRPEVRPEVETQNRHTMRRTVNFEGRKSSVRIRTISGWETVEIFG